MELTRTYGYLRMAGVPVVVMGYNLLEFETPQIPEKLFFRIGEVSRMVGVPPHVLRFWESEFPEIAPRKSGRGHRRYRRKDVELFLQIKHLLYEKKFTIEGARGMLRTPSAKAVKRNERRPEQGHLFAVEAPTLEQIRAELAEILKLLG